MTYDPVNDVVYSINYDEAGEAYTLSKLDLQTLDFTVVAPMENSYRGMCIDGEGQMYVIDDYGDVYKFDKESAVQGEKVVSTGFFLNILNRVVGALSIVKSIGLLVIGVKAS